MPISPLPPTISEKTRTRVFREVMIFAFCAVIFFLCLFVLFSDEGLIALYRTRGQFHAAQRELEIARRENDRLNIYLEHLRNDPSALEAVAREKLRMVKPGEEVYLFVERKRKKLEDD
jgi:cell division protein FtsB